MKKSDIKKLESIQNVQDIKSFLLVRKYEDDHLQCSTVLINGIEVDFDYYDDLGFLTYYKDSPTAFNDLKEAIKTSIEIFLD